MVDNMGACRNGGADKTSETETGTSAKSCPLGALAKPLDAFLKDYVFRHKHPVNAALHVVGVPAAFLGFFYLLTGRKPLEGGVLVFVGYLLQYLGHQAQGNEVGEVTLAKKIYQKLKARG